MAVVGLAAGAHASESVTSAGGGGFYSGQADGQTDTSDFDVMIQTFTQTGGTQYGSGGLFAMNSVTKGGNAAVTLGIATADHVFTNATNWIVSLPDGSGMVSLSSQLVAESYTARGNGNHGLEDLGFVGLTIYQNQVGASTWNYLQTLTDVNGLLGLASPTSGLVIHNYGYGRSGEYLTAAGPVLTTNTPANVTGFQWSQAFPPADQGGAGIGRVTNQISTGISEVNNTVIAGYNYDYDAMTWALPANNPAHLGQINSADSGGPIMSFNGSMVGVNTLAKGQINAPNTEDFVYGDTFAGTSYAGAGVAFNQGDLNFLNNSYAIVAAPEPTTMLGLALLGIGTLARRRRRA
ncbi:MAG: PEP-CTERM sorting domain-containing protein [Fimbriimonadaceae bacterium]